jgi:transposase
VSRFDARRMRFVDESGATITLARRYGRAPRGERSCGSVPRNYGKNLTLCASLSLEGIEAPMLVDGAMDTSAFAVYVEHFLVPTLRPGELVILDNLAVHKQAGIKAAIRAAGCSVLFLPSYSPDFNPIEQAFAKIKAAMRRAGARTRDALETALAAAIERVTASDATGFFRSCGYTPGSIT